MLLVSEVKERRRVATFERCGRLSRHDERIPEPLAVLEQAGENGIAAHELLEHVAS